MCRTLIRLTLWVSFSLGLFALTGCTSNKAVVRFAARPPELYSKKSLAQFLKNSPNPKIVLRASLYEKAAPGNPVAAREDRDSRSGAVPSETETIVCNAIEKQLFRAGFNVRDRTLFNEVLRKAGDIDYTTVNGLTDTDLILELVKLNTRIPYITSKYYQQKKSGEVEKEIPDPKNNITLYGGQVEFKLIHIRTNQVLGSYLFNYVPCLEGCPYEIQSDGSLQRAASTARSGPPEQNRPDYLERFVTRATQQLVQAMKQTPGEAPPVK
ncbi:hypothetical protein [Larkinella soli]|uniref:hypothetical protein n=1 Tax=Larkinella soli TaxID=1770527 RepID=UPI000FFC8DFC|nr:hypothetical protein [Larkinella soli]